VKADDVPEVVDVSDLRPCPPMTGPWPERVTARCVCCEDRLEVFIGRRAIRLTGDAWYEIPREDDATLLARSASSVGLDGRGGWLLIADREKGLAWCCRTCAESAVDFSRDEVQTAVGWWSMWQRIDVVDLTSGVAPRWRSR